MPVTPTIYSTHPIPVNTHCSFLRAASLRLFSIISWQGKESNYSNDKDGNIADIFLI